MSKWENQKKPVVVIGGGGAGATFVRTFSQAMDASKYELIMINPLPYRICLPSTVRMVVTPTDNLAKTALIPYDKIFVNRNGTYKQGKVQSISVEGYESGDGGVVVLESGERIPYHILVLASGSFWPGPTNFPGTEEAVQKHIAEHQQDVKNAKNIVLIGGGAVGVEIAAEIKTEFPDKKVTIVHGMANLTNETYTLKFRQALEKRLQKIGIELLLDEMVTAFPPRTGPEVTTRSGKSVPADLVLVTTGPKPNTLFIKESLGDSAVSEAGFVKVHPTLQVASHPNIFAIGDIIEWNEQKQVLKAYGHASTVSQNILKLGAGQPLKNYQSMNESLCCTTGRHGGLTLIGYFGGITLGDWFTRMMKSKDLLVPESRKAMGLSS